VFWPAWILHYLGVDIGARPTQFLVDHPSLYLTGYRAGARESYVFWMLCLVLAMVVTARNNRRLDSPDSRRRIRLVVAALMIALIPFALVTAAYRFGAINDEIYRRYLGPIAFLLMIGIPLSLAAAVWKEQLFDIKVLVRRGLQYGFARAALGTLLILPIALPDVAYRRGEGRIHALSSSTSLLYFLWFKSFGLQGSEQFRVAQGISFDVGKR
jgi:hypothetical protein